MDTINNLSEAEIKTLSFEEAYERLTDTTGKLERGNLSLENSLSLYEEGVLLSRHCEELLNTAELRITQITPSSLSDEIEEDDEDEDEEYDENDDEEDEDGDLTLADIDF